MNKKVNITQIEMNNYYPFGMVMGQNIEGDYRYGYQGENAEEEELGATHSFEVRLWDARIGRWLSVDPLVGETGQAYIGMGNNPIYYNDPTGMIAEAPLIDFLNAETGEVKHVDDGIDQVVVVGGDNWNWTNMYEYWVNKEGAEANPFDAYNTVIEGEVHAVNEHGMVELPSDGNPRNGQYTFEGETLYKVHNRNDMSFGGKTEQDQWGTPENIAKFMSLGIKFKNEFGAVLSFGDLSTGTGNSPRYNSRGTRHKTHYSGSQADLKYPTVSGGLTNYDRGASIERTQFIIDFSIGVGFGHRVI